MPTLEHECYLLKPMLPTCMQGSCVYVDIQGVGVGGHVTNVGVAVETMSPQAASMEEMHVCHICEVVIIGLYMYFTAQCTLSAHLQQQLSPRMG